MKINTNVQFVIMAEELKTLKKKDHSINRKLVHQKNIIILIVRMKKPSGIA